MADLGWNALAARAAAATARSDRQLASADRRSAPPHRRASHVPGDPQRRRAAIAGAPGRPGADDHRRRPASRRREAAQSGGGRSRCNVTIPFGSLAGLTDEPGELDGYGPIPAHVARELAAAGVWTWLRTDPGTGQLLDLGRTRYRPTKALADFITARDRTCRMPGCHRPRQHRRHRPHRPVRRRRHRPARPAATPCAETHHLLKHRGGWRVDRQPDGTTIWTSPTGHRYPKPPRAVGPIMKPNSTAVSRRSTLPPDTTANSASVRPVRAAACPSGSGSPMANG